MPKIPRVCLNCKKDFEIDRWRLKSPNRGKYCSWNCSQNRVGTNAKHWKGGNQFAKCFLCSKEFEYSRMTRKRKFCSQKCHSDFRHLYLSGENSHSYIDGRKMNTGNLHLSYEYRQWRKAVMANWDKCRRCGSLENLTADHIKPIYTHPYLAYVTSNGQVLCKSCHYKKNAEDIKKIVIYRQELQNV